MSSRVSLLVLLLLVAGQQPLADARMMRRRTVNLVRLPTRFQPINYNLNLTLSPESRKFTGTVEIEMEVREMDTDATLISRSIGEEPDHYTKSEKNIILHAEKLTLTTAVLHQGKDEVYVDFILHDPITNILVLKLKRTPILSVSSKLVINFYGEVQDEPKGLFWNKLNSNSWALATNFKRAYARRLFPCFDEPEFKATFKLTITHPKKFMALSNMEIMKTYDNDFYSMTTQFRPTPKMPTYLLSFAVGKFTSISESLRNGLSVTIHAPVSLAPTKDMHNIALHAYDKVTEYFSGLTPPIQKIDIVALDNGPTAIENWGLIAMRWDILSANPRDSKPNDWINAVALMMRQMIDQHFANSVTIGWWDEWWLKEGLTAHLAGELYQEIYSELYAMVEITFSAMNDDYQKARSINGRDFKRTVYKFEESFDLFTYKKSAAIISMFAHFFGKASVKSSIHQMIWINTGHEPVNAGAWWDALSSRAPEYGDMKNVASQWVQRNGYPTIFVEHKIFRGRRVVHVSQGKCSGPQQCWPVPIQYEFHGGPENEPVRKGKFVLYGLESWVDLPEWFNIDDANQWFTFNPNYQGYYSVVYPHFQTISTLSKVIKSGRMEAAEQLRVLSDMYFVSKRIKLMEGFWQALLSLPKRIHDGVMLLLTRILAELDSSDWSPESVKLVTQLMRRHYTANGRVWNLAGSDMLNFYARGQVVDFLVNKLECESVIDEVDVIMMNTERMPPFLQDVLDNRQKKEQAQDVYRP